VILAAAFSENEEGAYLKQNIALRREQQNVKCFRSDPEVPWRAVEFDRAPVA